MSRKSLELEEIEAGEDLVQRTFPITRRQDDLLSDWAKRLPGFPKSFIVRVVIELGLAEFSESPITRKMQDGAISLWSGGLTEQGPGRKRKAATKKRS